MKKKTNFYVACAQGHQKHTEALRLLPNICCASSLPLRRLRLLLLALSCQSCRVDFKREHKDKLKLMAAQRRGVRCKTRRRRRRANKYRRRRRSINDTLSLLMMHNVEIIIFPLCRR